MERPPPALKMSSSSRRRVMRWLVGSSLSEVERDLIIETLLSNHGNRTRAARLLHISVRTLRNKIAVYSQQGMTVPQHHPCFAQSNPDSRVTNSGDARDIED